jgi:hypothetical protein
MTIEALLIIIGFCLVACYLVLKWQESVVDIAVPPYQEPLEDQLEPTELNPQATWPFPTGRQP